MKNIMKQMYQYIKQGLIWADNHKKRTLLLLIVLVAVIYGISSLVGIKIDKEVYSFPKSSLSNTTGDISLDSGKTLVYENTTKEMWIEPATTNITIVDKATGTTWDTLGLDAIMLDNKGEANDASTKFASPFVIDYLGEDGSQGSMNAYTYSIKDKDYSIKTIDKGVQLTFEVQNKTINVFEHLPRKIRIERYENFIIAKAQEILENGQITQSEFDNFTMLWGAFYVINTKEGAYVYSASSKPPISSIVLMVKVLDLIGYDMDELIKDNSEFGEKTTFEVKTKYKVVIETTLEGDDFVVKIPTAYASSNNDFNQITSISVFPYFGNFSSEVVDNNDPGYIFVPDGSGALIQLNHYNSDYPVYTKPVYNNTQYDKYYLLNDYEKDINMPVFGMYGNLGDSYKGFLGIIENGAETATINAQSAKPTKKSKEGKILEIGMNQVNTQFDVIQKSNVFLFGYYADDTTSHLSTSMKYDFNAVVRYKLLVNDKIDYYQLATIYKDYLIDRFDIDVNYDTFKPTMFIDLIGNVTVLKHFLGIPYSSDLSMTTYKEAQTILDELDGVSKVVNYKGAVNGGLNQSLLSKIKFVKENGTQEEFEALQDYANSNNDALYVDLKFTQVYDENNGFNKKMGLYGLDSKPLLLYQFNLASKRFDFTTTPHYILSPSYLGDLVDRFIDHNDYFDNISLNDLGNTYLVDFNKQNKVSPFAAFAMVDENLQKLDRYNLMLNDPYINNIQYAKYAENISRESSNNFMFSASIPFRQLIMNGITQYSTPDVNIQTSQSNDYYLLQALELGSHPKFTLSYKDSSLLKETEFNYYYSTQYTNWVDTIKSMYNDYVNAFDEIGTNQIVNHEMLTNNVFKTTYETGYSVIVNYNDYEVTVGEKTIPALGYQIESGVE